jgi:multiple antibiotic resistance protein
MDLLSAAITLALVIDPIGNIPAFLAALENTPPERRSRVILREMCIALLILALFLFFGKRMLAALNISGPALSVAGGVVLFLVSINMIFPARGMGFSREERGEPFITPLAVPLAAGPSAMTAVMLLGSREPDRIWLWFLALLIAWSVSAVTLLAGDQLRRLLGDRMISALEKLMGMILTTIAVQMLLEGVREFWRS